MARKPKDGMLCPHCNAHISKTVLLEALGAKKTKSGRKKVETECAFGCGYVGGVREMKQHIVVCPKREYASEKGKTIAETKAKAKAGEARGRRKNKANG